MHLLQLLEYLLTAVCLLFYLECISQSDSHMFATLGLLRERDERLKTNLIN